MAKATFAGGCFWCMEPPFEKMDGVIKVEAGYTGGKEKNPSYSEVSSGLTSHMEAILVTYDPSKVSYKSLLEVFWRQIDPTDGSGQFADRGTQYQTAIFYHDDNQKELALESKKDLEKRGLFSLPIVTPILPAGAFYPAEEYHQDYYKKNPGHYKRYRMGSGREYFLQHTWGKTVAPQKEQKKSELWLSPSGNSMGMKKKKLTPLQLRVTQEGGTEPPFDNAYWSLKEPGLYVDVVSGEPLFSSNDKFDSGSGWPSFTRPLNPDSIVEDADTSHGMVRVEVKSRLADSHLGHVFNDGPLPSGRRYCINSAALEFIPKSELKKRGYGEYERLFR